jgi:hypothetical protein
MVITAWQGIGSGIANDAFEELSALGKFGLPVTRGNRQNKDLSCCCQGNELDGGASYSFGCDIRLFNYHLCKFGRGELTRAINKFNKLRKEAPKEIEETLQELATIIAVLLSFAQCLPKND